MGSHKVFSSWIDVSSVSSESTGRNVRVWIQWGGGGKRPVRLKLVPGQTIQLSRGATTDEGYWNTVETLAYDGAEVVLTIDHEIRDYGGGCRNVHQATMGPGVRWYSPTDDDERRRIGGVWRQEQVPMPVWTKCRHRLG